MTRSIIAFNSTSVCTVLFSGLTGQRSRSQDYWMLKYVAWCNVGVCTISSEVNTFWLGLRLHLGSMHHPASGCRCVQSGVVSSHWDAAFMHSSIMMPTITSVSSLLHYRQNNKLVLLQVNSDTRLSKISMSRLLLTSYTERISHRCSVCYHFGFF